MGGTNVETSQFQRLATPNLARLTANWDNGMDGNPVTSSVVSGHKSDPEMSRLQTIMEERVATLEPTAGLATLVDAQSTVL